MAASEGNDDDDSGALAISTRLTNLCALLLTVSEDVSVKGGDGAEGVRPAILADCIASWNVVGELLGEADKSIVAADPPLPVGAGDWLRPLPPVAAALRGRAVDS